MMMPSDAAGARYRGSSEAGGGAKFARGLMNGADAVEAYDYREEMRGSASTLCVLSMVAQVFITNCNWWFRLLVLVAT
jgi:hypothetical protein